MKFLQKIGIQSTLLQRFRLWRAITLHMIIWPLFSKTWSLRFLKKDSYDHEKLVDNGYLKIWLFTSFGSLQAAYTAILNNYMYHSLYLNDANHFMYHMKPSFYRNMKFFLYKNVFLENVGSIWYWEDLHDRSMTMSDYWEVCVIYCGL